MTDGGFFMHHYTATTEDIEVEVRPVYIDGQSDIMARKFVFAYFVRIKNRGRERIQILRRHWMINHGGYRVEEVEGEGVVGKQPVIPPGESHTYNSFCILESFEGTMEGTYLIQKEHGEFTRVTIPRFTLRALGN